MNYDAPLQRKDGRWEYTANGRPWGYCRPWQEFSETSIANIFSGDRDRYEKYAAPYREAVAAGKYHDHGHATEEEACECYKTHQLDFTLRMWPTPADPSTLHRCKAEGCKEMTGGYAEVGNWNRWFLCDTHRNRDTIATLFRVGESWHS